MFGMSWLLLGLDWTDTFGDAFQLVREYPVDIFKLKDAGRDNCTNAEFIIYHQTRWADTDTVPCISNKPICTGHWTWSPNLRIHSRSPLSYANNDGNRLEPSQVLVVSRPVIPGGRELE